MDWTSRCSTPISVYIYSLSVCARNSGAQVYIGVQYSAERI